VITVSQQMDGRYYLQFGSYTANGMTLSEALHKLAETMEPRR
jgi:hypothetical protein